MKLKDHDAQLIADVRASWLEHGLPYHAKDVAEAARLAALFIDEGRRYELAVERAVVLQAGRRIPPRPSPLA
jgi:hypothetical protein